MNIKRSINKRIDKILGRGESQLSKPIFNLYHTNYDRSVLISYITSPFRSANHFVHQNFVTSHIIAESFSELGYNVDVVDYLDTKSVIDFGNYAVIFGFGHSLERSFYAPNREIPRILFITGVHEDLHNRMTLRSVTDFYKRSNKWLPAEADVLPVNTYYSMYNADVTIILAKGFVFENCKSRFDNRLHSLNNNIIGSFTTFQKKTKETRNSNFLFLSGGRLLKKGLSILLEVAKTRHDLNFYIVVPHINIEFENYYRKELYESPNIFLSKSLRMDSPEMKEIVEKCSYCLAPSYADGFPGGTIEPMSAGLIPIVSRYCGFAHEEFIFEMQGELAPLSLSEAIDKALSLDDDTYVKYSNAVKNYTIDNFSTASVKKDLLKILKLELDNEK